LSAEDREYYIDQHRQLHDEGKFEGWTIARHKDQISDLIDEYDPRTILDYGCGKAKFYQDHWGLLDVTLYDPGYDPYSQKPTGTFDAVLCVDVMEHIPECETDNVLAELRDYADKFVFLSICTREARKTLPDGSNAHVNIKPVRWWMKKLNETFRDSGISFCAEFT